MPFDEEKPKDVVQKTGLKPMAGQKSMFDGKPRPPTQQEFQQKVQAEQEQSSGYNKRAAELFIQFSKTMADKTLSKNRNMFNAETEKEMLQNMIRLATDLNNDPNEEEQMGSLTLVICLLKTCLAQRDRINEIEYALLQMQNKLNTSIFTDYINKEIAKVLDNKK
jgi:hypothetical protein